MSPESPTVEAQLAQLTADNQRLTQALDTCTRALQVICADGTSAQMRGRMATALLAALTLREPPPSFQARVEAWLVDCFGEAVANDAQDRSHRFVEEALELAQACGCSADEAHQLVDYVFNRPVGEVEQEVGGVMVTLAGVCRTQGLDMAVCGEVELDHNHEKQAQIQAKQASKPDGSPLPGSG